MNPDMDKFLTKITDSFRRSLPPAIIQQPIQPQLISTEPRRKSPTEQAKIIIKQTVKQTINEKKRRKKSARKGDDVAAKRKEYNTLKKEIKKRFLELKKLAYQSESGKIKGLKAADRKAARAKLKKDLTGKLRALVAKMPAATKKTFGELESLISGIKKLKW